MRYFLSLIAVCSPLLALQVVEDTSQLVFKTPSMAEITTRKITLDNGLSAYLISDPAVEESGVTLAVEAGSWQDPKEASGMAHFTEHMLFLGNASYPEENHFRALLETHNGKANAFTADQFTCYMFTIDSAHLDEALSPFSHFFIDPLFTSSAMSRERGAVDQEFERAKESDPWREEMVRKAIANPKHPHSDFGFGSHETLGSLTTEEMRSWFESHYSSQIMHVIVYSSLPLDTLQALVDTHFSQIPHRGVGPFVTEGTKSAPQAAGKLLAIKPHKALRNMTLSWELPYNDQEEREYGTARLATYLLGHEGEGSLGSDLKSRGLIEGIATHSDAYRKAHSPTYTLALSIDLTQKGLQERDYVIERIFEAINSYKQGTIEESLFDEMQTVRRLNYEYSTRSDLFNVMREHAMHLAEEPLASYPEELVLAKQFDPKKTEALFKQLTPYNAHYNLLADPKETLLKPTYKEPHMGARYTLTPFPKEQLSQWDKAPATPSFPTPNPYLPKNLTLTQTRGLSEPLLLFDDDYGQLYYADDPSLAVPEITWIVAIKSPAVVMGDPKTAALLDLLLATVQHALNEESYSAKLGGLTYTLKPYEEGIQIVLEGFRDKASVLFSKLLSTLRTVDVTESDFTAIKEALERKLNNVSKDSPAVQAIELMRALLIEGFVTAADKASALKNVTLDELIRFRDAFTKNTYVQGMLFGNFTAEEGSEIAEDIRHFQTNPYPKGKVRKMRVATLPKQGPFLVIKKSASRGTAAVLTVQEDPYSLANRSLQQLLASAIEEPFFSDLRTRQQTGYIVWSWDEDLERHLFQSFLVQSNTHDGRDLVARYESFIEEFLRALKTGAFTEGQFDTLKRSLIAKLKRPPKNPKEAATRLFTYAFDVNDFDWIEHRLAATEHLTYEQFVRAAQGWLGKDNKRRLGVLLQGKLPQDAIQYKTLTSPQKWRALSDYQPSGSKSASSAG